MSWHYLQEQEAAFSLADYLAGIQSPPAKSNPTHEPSYSPASGTASSPTSPSGTTSEPSTAHPSATTSTSSQEASPARTSQPQEKEQASPAPAPASGQKCTESFAKYNHATHSWKTPQCSLLEDLDTFSQTWPRAGIMLHGSCSELPTSAHPTTASASGYSQNTAAWPTPQASDYKRANDSLQTCIHRANNGHQIGLHETVKMRMLPTPTCQDAKNNGAQSQQERNTKPLNAIVGGALNPTWVEWLMGWPLGWTDLKPLATDKYHSWLQQHSSPLNKH